MTRKFWSITLISLALFGCVTSDELIQTQRSISILASELERHKLETRNRILEMERSILDLGRSVDDLKEKTNRALKEQERLRNEILGLSERMDLQSERLRGILGRLDEQDYQLNTYWKQTKEELSEIKKLLASRQKEERVEIKPAEDLFREALEGFRKGMYDESRKNLTELIKSHPTSPLLPNAYFWLGEIYMAKREYERAILAYQEVIEKYRTSDVAPKSYLSQAEAFLALGDKRSAQTILKRLTELYPKSDEAKIAERRLRSLLSD